MRKAGKARSFGIGVANLHLQRLKQGGSICSSEGLPPLMNNKRAIWVVLAVIALLLAVLAAHKPAARPKAVAQRITAVNVVRNVSMVFTNTNALSLVRSNSAK
jgi:hypothetical protein